MRKREWNDNVDGASDDRLLKIVRDSRTISTCENGTGPTTEEMDGGLRTEI